MLSLFSLYPVNSLRTLAQYMRARRGSVYSGIEIADCNVCPRLMRRLIELHYAQRCGDYVYLTNAGIDAAVTSN